MSYFLPIKFNRKDKEDIINDLKSFNLEIIEIFKNDKITPLLRDFIFIKLNERKGEKLDNLILFLKEKRVKYINTGGEEGKPYFLEEKDFNKIIEDNQNESIFVPGKSIIILKGLFKGYEGIIESVNEEELIIDLNLNEKGNKVSVKVLKDFVKIK